MSTAKDKEQRYEVVILSRYCKGCRLCVDVCETGHIEIETSPNERGIQPARILPQSRCSGCMRCTAICPEAAIEITRLEEDKKNIRRDIDRD